MVVFSFDPTLLFILTLLGELMAPKDAPRLTSALRAFASLSLPYETPSPDEYKQLVAAKLKQRAAKEAAGDGLQWRDLSTTIKSVSVASKKPRLGSALRELLQESKNIGKIRAVINNHTLHTISADIHL